MNNDFLIITPLNNTPSNMLEQIEKIIIIIGCQRSGTTLIGQMLGTPENSILLDESDGIYEWFDLFVEDDPDTDQHFNHVLSKAKGKYRASSQRIISNNGEHTLNSEVRYLILKAPNLTFRFEDISRINIPTSIVYAVREPKAVVASMMELNHIDFVGNQIELLKKIPSLFKEFEAEALIMIQKNQQPHVNNALLWKVKSSLYSHFSFRNIQTYVCKYEELVENPEIVCNELAEQLGIPFDNTMLTHQSVFQGNAQGQTDRTRPVDKGSTNKWLTHLNKNQIEQINSITKTTVNSLGYSTKIETSKSSDQSIVAILGMHRSGTSCLTGCLQDCGLNLGEVVNKAPHNHKGNKESLTLRKINIQVLSFNGGSWENPPEQIQWSDELRIKRDLIISIHSTFNQWGFKDPRTLLTLPFWLEAIPDLKFIGSFRHPIAVARSHNQRDGLDIEKGLKLWEKYNLKLLEYLDIYNFPIVCFDWPSDEYIKTTLFIAKEFGLDQINENEAIPFYDKNLRRQNFDNMKSSIPNEIMTLYEKLCSKADAYKLLALNQPH